MFDTFIEIFAPFSTAFNATHYDMTVLISNAYLGSIWTPLKRADSWHFSIVYHFVDPLSIMLHEHDNESATVTAG